MEDFSLFSTGALEFVLEYISSIFGGLCYFLRITNSSPKSLGHAIFFGYILVFYYGTYLWSHGHVLFYSTYERESAGCISGMQKGLRVRQDGMAI